MSRSDRKNSILAILQSGPASVYSLASRLDAPDASVRRLVQVLRQEGHNILDARDNNGQYRLIVSNPVTGFGGSAATI